MGGLRAIKEVAAMTERWKCAHGLHLEETCGACDAELARELLRHWQKPVAEAQRVLEEAERERAE